MDPEAGAEDHSSKALLHTVQSELKAVSGIQHLITKSVEDHQRAGAIDQLSTLVEGD